MRTMNNSMTPTFRGRCSVSLLYQSKEGQEEEKCTSGTGRAEKEMLQGGGGKRRKNWQIIKESEGEKQNDSRN